MKKIDTKYSDFVAFSGGADSTALALLQPQATPIFTDTGWEFDELYAHIEKFEHITGRQVIRISRQINKKPETIPDYIRRSKFMPNHGARYCTRQFKIQPMNTFLKANLPATLMIGLRADEERVGNLTKMEGLDICYPHREAGRTKLDILRICLQYDLLPRYPVYMARGGCIGCFYKRKSEVQAMCALVPHVVDSLEILEKDVQDERGRYFNMFPNCGMSITDMRRQPLLFDASLVYQQAADKSDVGPNCGLFCNR